MEKVWNYAPPAYEWGCATANAVITLEPNSSGPPAQPSSTPSGSNGGNGNENGNNDTNSNGNQISGNYLTDGGSIVVEGEGDSGGKGGAAASGGNGQGASSDSGKATQFNRPSNYATPLAVAILFAAFFI